MHHLNSNKTPIKLFAVTAAPLMGFSVCFGRLIGAVTEVEVAGRGVREGVSKKVRCIKKQTDRQTVPEKSK